RGFCYERLGGDMIVLAAMTIPFTIYFAHLRVVITAMFLQLSAFIAANVVVTISMRHAAMETFQDITIISGSAFYRTTMAVVLDERTALVMFRSVILCLVAIAVFLMAWKRDEVIRADYRGIAKLLQESQQGSKLYETLAQQTTATLPTHVVRRLLLMQRVRDFVPHAGIMAFGISSFPVLCAHYSCSEVVEALNGLFSILDQELNDHPDVTKMQTLGDLFIAVCGISWEVADVETDENRNDSDDNGGSRICAPDHDQRPTLAAIELNRYAMVVHSACVASTIITRFETSFTIALHSGPITATTFGKSAAYVCVGSGMSECINALRSSTMFPAQVAASTLPGGSQLPSRPRASLGGVVITTPTFRQLLDNAPAMLQNSHKSKTRFQKRADNLPVALRLEELRRLQQVFREGAADPGMDGDEGSISVKNANRKPSPGISSSTARHQSTVTTIEMFATSTFDMKSKSDSSNNGTSSRLQSAASIKQSKPSDVWMPRKSTGSVKLFCDASYASDETELQFQQFCTEIGEDSVIARWGFAFDGSIHTVIVVCVLVFYSHHMRDSALQAFLGLGFCVLAAAIPWTRTMMDFYGRVPASTLDSKHSSLQRRGAAGLSHQQQQHRRTPASSSAASESHVVDKRCVRGSMKLPWYISLAAAVAAQFILPHSWTASWCAVFLATMLLWRCALPLVASQPHIMILVDSLVVCVPLTGVKIARIFWFVNDAGQRLFPLDDNLSAAAQNIVNNDHGPLVAMIVQSAWTLLVVLPIFMWITRVARQENHRQMFERRRRAAIDMELIERQRETLQQHIRSVIPLHMQNRFEDFQKHGMLADDGNDTIDPWRGTWFATNVQETPLLVIELASVPLGDHSVMQQSTSVGSQSRIGREGGRDHKQLVMELEEAHRRVDSVLSMMTSVCKAKSAGDVIILMGSENDEEAVRAMKLMECAAALQRTFGPNNSGPKIVLNSGPAVGAVIGSDRLTFELFGEAVSTSMELLHAMPMSGVVATQRFIMLYHQLQQAALLPCFPSKLHHHQHQQVGDTPQLPYCPPDASVAFPDSSQSVFPTPRHHHMNDTVLAAGMEGASPLISQHDGSSVVDLGFRLYLSITGGVFGSGSASIAPPRNGGAVESGSLRVAHHAASAAVAGGHITASSLPTFGEGSPAAATTTSGEFRQGGGTGDSTSAIADASVTMLLVPIRPEAKVSTTPSSKHAVDTPTVMGQPIAQNPLCSATAEPRKRGSISPAFSDAEEGSGSSASQHICGPPSREPSPLGSNQGEGREEQEGRGAVNPPSALLIDGTNDGFLPSALPPLVVVDSLGLALAIPPKIAMALPRGVLATNSHQPHIAQQQHAHHRQQRVHHRHEHTLSNGLHVAIGQHDHTLGSDVQIGALQLWKVRGCGTIALHTIHLSFV
ncbi:guanylate cyclase-like protein, putative, partial [Bodo saltans]